jgi:hypothetical protein
MWHSVRTESDCTTCELEAMNIKLGHQQEEIEALRETQEYLRQTLQENEERRDQ